MIHPPETLYLQWDVLGDGADATWCEDMVDDDDIVYVHKKRFDALVDVNNDNVARIAVAEHDVTVRDRAIQRLSEEITLSIVNKSGLWEREIMMKKRVAELETVIELRNQHIVKHISEIEQLRVQLAGCSVAAFGEVAHAAKIGDYGWSPAYQDVVDLRIKYDNLEKQITDKTLDVSRTGEVMDVHMLVDTDGTGGSYAFYAIGHINPTEFCNAIQEEYEYIVLPKSVQHVLGRCSPVRDPDGYTFYKCTKPGHGVFKATFAHYEEVE